MPSRQQHDVLVIGYHFWWCIAGSWGVGEGRVGEVFSYEDVFGAKRLEMATEGVEDFEEHLESVVTTEILFCGWLEV